MRRSRSQASSSSRACSPSSRACATCSASTATAANAEELVVGAGVRLAATLTLPPGLGPHPALVPLHPADDPSREQVLFRHLAEVLPAHGVAVLRYDRRADNVPFEEQAADALSAVGLLCRRADVDPRRIGLWGFSQGAWIAPMVAARTDRVAYLVLVASVGVTPRAQMRYGTAKQARQAGFGDADIARLLEIRAVLEDYNRGRIARDRAQRAVLAVAGEPWFEHAWVRSELPPRSGFWPDMDFDPEPTIRAVHVPTLLFYGEDDEWQPIEESIATWRRAGDADLSIVRLAGTGHAPMVGGHNERAAIAPEYERSLLAWLTSRGFAGRTPSLRGDSRT